MSEMLIETRGLSAGYGRMPVIHDIDLHVMAGEVVALIGLNGAGKTTTLLTLAGEIRPHAGDVRIGGKATTSPMHVRCRTRAIGYVPEERSVIMNMSVGENLRLAGVSPRVACGFFPALDDIMDRTAGLCSGGEQQMLSLAAALGRNPRLLLIDELSLGLAPIIVADLLLTVRRAADEHGVGVLLVEQHVRQALTIADRVYLMERGRVGVHGTAAEMREQLDRIEARYLAAERTPRQ